MIFQVARERPCSRKSHLAAPKVSHQLPSFRRESVRRLTSSQVWRSSQDAIFDEVIEGVTGLQVNPVQRTAAFLNEQLLLLVQILQALRQSSYPSLPGSVQRTPRLPSIGSRTGRCKEKREKDNAEHKNGPADPRTMPSNELVQGESRDGPRRPGEEEDRTRQAGPSTDNPRAKAEISRVLKKVSPRHAPRITDTLRFVTRSIRRSCPRESAA